MLYYQEDINQTDVLSLSNTNGSYEYYYNSRQDTNNITRDQVFGFYVDRLLYLDLFENDIYYVLDYSDWLPQYMVFYASIHGYLSLITVIIGLFANALNILVLSSKKMRTPINAILTALATADIMVLLSYLLKIFSSHPFNYVSYFDGSFPMMCIILILLNSHVVSHAVSVWLTIVAAIWRVMSVCYPATSLRWRSLCRARIAILFTFLASILIFIPRYGVSQITLGYGFNEKYYRITHTMAYNTHREIFLLMEVWLCNVIMKIVPCIPLTGISVVLIRAIYKANENRQKLNMRSGSNRNHSRTTKMLVVILLIFLFTNLPRGILYVFGIGLNFEYAGYLLLVSYRTLEFLILLNSSVNFFVYCSMSTPFRETFSYLFLEPLKRTNIYVDTRTKEQLTSSSGTSSHKNDKINKIKNI